MTTKMDLNICRGFKLMKPPHCTKVLIRLGLYQIGTGIEAGRTT